VDEATRPTARGAARPRSISAAAAGADRRPGWIAPDGRFYAAERWTHVRMAAQLRATGDGPADPWTMADGWVLVRAHGEAVCLPGITQAQWDTLGDLLIAAPPGVYRRHLLESLRQLRDLEAHIVSEVRGRR
jgi:hypothetical protein